MTRRASGGVGRRRALAGAAVAAVLLGTAPAVAQDATLSAIPETRERLREAGEALRRADTPAERVAAVAAAIRAHEDALASLREGLRRLAAEDRRLLATLEAEHERLTALLGALQSLARAPASALLAFPGGPVRASRSAGMIAGVAPGLRSEVEALRLRLTELRALRIRQEGARAEARGALAGLQALRAEGARRDGGAEAPDAEELRALARAAERSAADLVSLAAALGDGEPAERAPFAEREGALAPPVSGRVSAGFGDADPWGRPGEGLTFTAPAYAQVTAPVDATVRYAGPLPDYDKVVILEPEDGWLMVLAGLASVSRIVGETVLAGERIGDLGGPLPSSEEFLLEAGGEDSQIRNEALYVELRRAGTAIDPGPWFATPGK